MQALQYTRAAQLPAILAQRIVILAGAWAVTVVSADFLRKLLPLVLLGVLVYTRKKRVGTTPQAPP